MMKFNITDNGMKGHHVCFPISCTGENTHCLCGILAQNEETESNYEESLDKLMSKGIQQNNCHVIFRNIDVMKHKRLRNCSSLKEIKESQQCNGEWILGKEKHS